MFLIVTVFHAAAAEFTNPNVFSFTRTDGDLNSYPLAGSTRMGSAPPR